MIILYVTHKDEKSARIIINHLMKKKLIACTNLFPIRSVYEWEGKIVDEKEIVTLLKTSNKLYSKVESEIKKIHPYKIPCIIKIDAKVNKDYEKWVDGCLV
ncbi:MAG: divalent-cation tolerance protein CutA [Candidatus Woesearchaeota archaeon]